jgi:hypothetical protein
LIPEKALCNAEIELKDIPLVKWALTHMC